MLFRHQNTLRTVGDTTPERKVSRVASHNLDDTAPLMGCRCITDLVDRFHRSIYSRIKSDRIIGTCNIQIDRSRNSDRTHAQICKLLRSCKRAVSADHDQTVDSIFLADRSGFLLSLFRAHLLTTCSLQDRTSTLDRVGYIACGQIDDLLAQKSVESSSDPAYFQSFGKRNSDYGTDRRVHSRCVSAASQYADRTHSIFDFI